MISGGELGNLCFKTCVPQVKRTSSTKICEKKLKWFEGWGGEGADWQFFVVESQRPIAVKMVWLILKLG